MNRHGLRRARYWGLAKVTVQVLLNVITVNLKRAAKLLRAGAAPIPVAVVGVSAGSGGRAEESMSKAGRKRLRGRKPGRAGRATAA